MERKSTSEKVIRIPIMVPIAIGIIIAIISASVLGTHLIRNAARYTATKASVTADGKFEYTELEDGTIEISKYKGTDTEVIIPETIDGKNVTSIKSFAFLNCTKITSIEIPDQVANIGGQAFQGCTNLTSINISKGVTSIGDAAFNGCIKLEEIIVNEDNVNYMSENGILFNYERTKIIRHPAGKQNEVEYKIPEEVEIIGNHAFEGCTNLRNIDILEGVQQIEYSAFVGCTNLISIKIPNSVTKINHSVFKDCTNLTNVEIGKGLTEMSTLSLFEGCEKLTNINVDSENVALTSKNGILFNKAETKIIKYPVGKLEEEYIIPEEIEIIGEYTFEGCINLKNIEMPSGLTTINRGAFEGCINLNKIEIPDKVTKIASAAFNECKSLSTIEIPEGVTTIESSTFENCESLSSIKIPEGVTKIGAGAFKYCTSLTNVEIPSTITELNDTLYIGDKAYYPNDIFSGCINLTNINVDTSNQNYASEDGVLFNKEKTEIIKYPEGKRQEKYSIPESVTSIKDGAFKDNEYLINLEIPEKVTTIGCVAFENCKNLNEVKIPKYVTEISESLFDGCTRIENIEIPEGVIKIGQFAFANCENLSNINIPESVTEIGTTIFWNSKIVKTISTGDTTTTEIELPDILKRALDENDIILYSSGGVSLLNCTLSEQKTKLIVDVDIANKKNAWLKVRNGTLSGLLLEVKVPSGTITYSTTEATKDMITATLHIAEGETIINNNGENTYTFTKNGEFTFEYIDTEGNSKQAMAMVNWIRHISSEKYNIEDIYISKIQPETTEKQFKSDLQANVTEINIYDSKGEVLTDNDIIATGMQLKIINGNETETYILVVAGDTNADGVADFKDMIQINKHRLKKNLLKGEYLLAADVLEDGGADFKDLVKVNKFRLHKITEL